MQIGIIGLPNVGKSTLFNCMTKAHAAVADYPFTTIEPNIGIVSVPDSRLAALGVLYKPEKLTPASIRFVDIAGLVKGASKGEGLGNKFLSHIREMDALLHVVDCFREGSEPDEEVSIVRSELLLADLDTVHKKISNTAPRAKCGIKEAKEDLEKLYIIKQDIENGNSPQVSLPELNLISSIPVFYAANMKDTSLALPESKYNFVKINAKLESEIVELSDQEKIELQVKSELPDIISAGYALLGLITFYTTVGTEIRAWNIKNGSTAQAAAGKIHSDFEKNFIRAEVFNFSELELRGSEKNLQENGLVRTEGREYIVKDGDILKIKI
ncbi:MAG: Ribosome-binding ATPase YchF [Elusimicrobia bacterium ADurb.Bin231]|nr:MAG: Ribosome-binding ATPase YchF [Elusimicrobia bacterium ADurb.Bin231]